MMRIIPAEFPSVMLTAEDGARAEIALDGGHVVSWVPVGASENHLFVSARSKFGPGTAIRGGIPVIFPQFGQFGPLQQHGFARNRRWTVVPTTNESAGRATLRLTDDDATRALWAHGFALTLDVAVHAATLSVTMTVLNTDVAPWAFTAAFHPYFAVADAFSVQVDGLEATRYRDALQDGAVVPASNDPLAITGALDRIYIGAPDQLTVRAAGRRLHIEKQGFPDAVVWNPGSEGTRSRADFAPAEEYRMVCVEAARIIEPVELAPGARWTARQVMRAGAA
jgi:glucose-6-phosphate 1-epimerase